MPVLSTLGAAIANVYGFTSGLIKDQYFNLVSLLLPGNGTNGAQNNTFLDSSNNTFTITRNGNTTQGTFSPFSQTGWGNYFDGTSDYLQISGNPANTLSTGTFEFWVYLNSTSSVPIFVKQRDGVGTWSAISIGSYVNTVGNWTSGTAGKIYFHSANGVTEAASTGTISANTWVHIAIIFSTSDCKFYINGSLDSTVNGNYSIPTENSPTWTRISSQPSGTTAVNGYISNFRFSNIARTISLPTSPYTSDANTLILTCQSNRFVDNSSSPLTITPNGNVTITPFSPFAPTQSYSAAAVGGSGYFDGTGDYLQIANSNDFDTNSTFTLECWVYTGSSGCMLGRGGGSASWSTTDGHQFILYITGGVLRWQFNSGGSPVTLDSGAIPLNSWVHCVVGYNGTTTRLWLNGVSAATSTSTYTLPTTRNIVRSGATASGDQLYLGYISGLRFVKSDVYGVSNTTITVPTAPLTAITNTSLLLNFTNAGITDATAKNDLETVGNAQISTTQSKWGGGSMSFDGTGDYLINGTINSSLFQFGSGDFTVEMWIYPTTVSVVQYLIDFRDPATSSNAGIQWFINSSAKTGIYVGDTAIIAASTTSISANVWTHLAVVRNGSGSGNYKLYINGTADATTGTNTTSLTQGFLTIAANANNRNTATTDKFNGYIDDLRVTRVARYTSNFTAPTAPFPVQ